MLSKWASAKLGSPLFCERAVFAITSTTANFFQHTCPLKFFYKREFAFKNSFLCQLLQLQGFMKESRSRIKLAIQSWNYDLHFCALLYFIVCTIQTIIDSFSYTLLILKAHLLVLLARYFNCPSMEIQLATTACLSRKVANFLGKVESKFQRYYTRTGTGKLQPCAHNYQSTQESLHCCYWAICKVTKLKVWWQAIA